jgi:hypothetical protein
MPRPSSIDHIGRRFRPPRPSVNVAASGARTRAPVPTATATPLRTRGSAAGVRANPGAVCTLKLPTVDAKSPPSLTGGGSHDRGRGIGPVSPPRPEARGEGLARGGGGAIGSPEAQAGQAARTMGGSSWGEQAPEVALNASVLHREGRPGSGVIVLG